MKVLIIECEAPEDETIIKTTYGVMDYIWYKVKIGEIKSRIEERDEPNKVQPSS